MRKMLSALFLILVGSQSASAGPAKLAGLTEDQKRDIALAIRVLVENGILYDDQNMGTKVDPDIIQELLDKGLLETTTSSVGSVCIGK